MSDDVFIMADIGGTNTRVALAQGVQIDPTSIQRFRNAEHSGLEEVLTKYLDQHKTTRPAAACAAIAGPVRNGQGTLTNLNWTVDHALLQRATGAKTVSVINDLQAQGQALAHLDDDKTKVIKHGAIGDTHAARLVIGVGTGFNAAAVYRTDTLTLVPPAEAGHVDLPTPSNELKDFASHFTAKNGFCSVEDALSGRGLSHLYTWHTGQVKDPAEIMADHAAGRDPQAAKAVATFSRALGTVCGNLALSTLPFGGIYLVGGVARAVSPYLNENGFEQAFCAKGRFAEFMQQFSVRVVEDDYAALTGMAGLLRDLHDRKNLHS